MYKTITCLCQWLLKQHWSVYKNKGHLAAAKSTLFALCIVGDIQKKNKQATLEWLSDVLLSWGFPSTLMLLPCQASHWHQDWSLSGINFSSRIKILKRNRSPKSYTGIEFGQSLSQYYLGTSLAGDGCLKFLAEVNLVSPSILLLK